MKTALRFALDYMIDFSIVCCLVAAGIGIWIPAAAASMAAYDYYQNYNNAPTEWVSAPDHRWFN